MKRVERLLLTILSVVICMRDRSGLVMGVLPSTSPISLDMVTGYEGSEVSRDTWYVD